MAKRGRPTLEEQERKREIIENSPKLFDDEPYKVKYKETYVFPEARPDGCTSLTAWLQWVYEFLILNTNVLSIIEIYEAGIPTNYSLLETTKADDPNINNLLETRIINKTLKGEIKSVFASQLLTEKYGWSSEANTKTFEGDIKFDFGK